MNTEDFEAIKQHQLRLIREGIWRCCLNCLNWNSETANANGPAGCGLFKAMPPPHVIVNGCKEYVDDIPF